MTFEWRIAPVEVALSTVVDTDVPKVPELEFMTETSCSYWRQNQAIHGLLLFMVSLHEQAWRRNNAIRTQ